MEKRKICVFCSSSQKLSEEYYKIAEELGKEIAKQGHQLVYGGTDVGMMKATANGTKENKGYVIGIAPEVIIDMGIIKPDCDVFHQTKSMSERKDLMASLSDAFIALPGGFGTLEEFSEIVTAKQLGIHNKPIILFNYNGFYDLLLSWFDHLYEEKIANISYKDTFYIASSVSDALLYLKEYQPGELVNKY